MRNKTTRCNYLLAHTVRRGYSISIHVLRRPKNSQHLSREKIVFYKNHQPYYHCYSILLPNFILVYTLITWIFNVNSTIWGMMPTWLYILRKLDHCHRPWKTQYMMVQWVEGRCDCRARVRRVARMCMKADCRGVCVDAHYTCPTALAQTLLHMPTS